MLRYKYIWKDFYNWQNLEFMRKTRNHPKVMEQVFTGKKISSPIEQEEWFNEVYSQNPDHHAWTVYDSKIMSPIGYIQMKLESAQHHRANTGIIIHPDYSDIGNEEKILSWCVDNGIKKLKFPIRKIQYYILESDERMLNILCNFGFEIDACLREHVVKNQVWRSVYVLSYIKTDDN